jgi:PPP family 3-phenylpropionic acid transporter
VIAEIVLFIYARKPLNRFGPVGLLVGGAALGAARWAVMAFDPPLAMTALLQVLHAGSYALTHLGTIYFIRRRLDEGFAGTAQGLFGAISGGVIMTGAISLAGWAFAAQGGAAYAWMAAMCLLALVLAMGLKRSAP